MGEVGSSGGILDRFFVCRDNDRRLGIGRRRPLINYDEITRCRAALQLIKDARPQTVFIFVPAQKYATAKAWADIGLNEAGIQLVTTQDVPVDEELPNMGNTALGVVSTGSYSVAATRPRNKAFLEASNDAYGGKAIPDFLAVGGWDSMAAIFDMLKATAGKFTADEATAFFKNWKDPDSPLLP
jgi:branched-chain amino acid transport system substrate-binding protein